MKRRTTSGIIMRTLEVIRTLNTHNRSTVSQLRVVTGISRPALYRILSALMAAGYVARNELGAYELTHLVRLLSDGFKDDEWIAEIASPVLDAVQRLVTWPTDLALYRNYSMWLRDTTRRKSPLVIDRGTIGYRLPLLATAAGLAYIASCPDEEIEEILDALRKSEDRFDAIAKDRRRTRLLIAKTRKDGYSSRQGGVVAETGSIAVPIFHGGHVKASIGITFFASVLEPSEAASKYLAHLKRAANEIELGMARLDNRKAG
jgi:IclR family mhp operon transcriptional activator